MPVAAAVIPLTSRSASGLPLCTKSMYSTGSLRSVLGRPEHDKPTGKFSLSAGESAGESAVLCIHWSVSYVSLVHPSAIQQQHETRDQTHPITTCPKLPSNRAPQGQVAGHAVAPPSDDRLVLVLGWSHTSNGSLNYYT